MIDLSIFESINNMYNVVWDTIVPYTMIIPKDTVNKMIPSVLLSIGVPEDQIRLLISMFVCFPLAFIHSQLPGIFLKKLFSIIFGVLILQFTFLEGWFHSISSALFVYLLARICPRKHMHHTIFFFSIGYLAISHIYRMYNDYMGWTLDYTTYLMVFIMKYSSFGYDLYDGLVDKAHIDAEAKTDSRFTKMYKQRQDRYITEMPSLFDFLAYVFHFAGFLTGPTIFYKEYINTIESKYFDTQHNYSRLPVACLRTFSGFIVLLIYVYLSSIFPNSLLVSDESEHWSLLHYVFMLVLCSFITRLRYQGMWKISEGVCICNGFGYQGKDAKGRDQWNGVINSDIYHCELCNNYSTFTHYWNIRTQVWLEKYTYQRTNGSLLCLYTVSAFWHGFYPGYYIFFLTLAVMQYENRLIHKKIYPYFEHNQYLNILYNIMGFIIMHLSIGNFADCFFLLSLKNALIVMNRTHWIGYITIAILFVVLNLLPTPKTGDKTVEKSKKE